MGPEALEHWISGLESLGFGDASNDDTTVVYSWGQSKR